ncbi:hypothetical protein ABIE52_006892 [Rhodococcus sp. OAS809]|uniref:hypothetical protein n=1 Tax=Rhodococcus sp. OAS809 TaxID=2663874 RepID=UPI0033993D57
MTAPSSTNIRPNMTIVVQGAVAFARTASLIEGDELERRVKNTKSMYPTLEPHTLISLSQCKIVPADPAQLSWEEAYVQSLFYEHKKNPEKGLGFEAKNVTRNLPTLLAADPDNQGSFRQIVDVEGEIAKDTVVRVVVSTFQSKDKTSGRLHPKLGLGLEAILVPTPEVPYAPRSAGARALDLSAFGITLSAPLVATNGIESGAHNENEVVGTDEYGLPAAPVQPAQPVQPVAAQPAAPVQPVQPVQPVAAQPAAPVQPVAAQPAAPVQPVAAQPAAPVQPVAAQPAAPVQPVQPAAPVQPVQPAAPVQPIVPVSPAYQVATPGAPVAPVQPAAPAVSNPDDPFAGAPSPNWGGAGIQLPA